MPFKGVCLTCNDEISADTKAKFGEALIAHHQNWMKRSRGSITDRCNVFEVLEITSEGKATGKRFGLEASMKIVFRPCRVNYGIRETPVKKGDSTPLYTRGV